MGRLVCRYAEVFGKAMQEASAMVGLYKLNPVNSSWPMA
jgi:hypothetical protein